jgi:hypothetical protein
MTYALIVLIALQALITALLVDRLTKRASKERETLEDRLMAMTNMDSFILHKAQQDPVPGDVSYVDESREWELSPGGGGNDDG